MKATVLSEKEFAQLQKAQQKAALAVVELGDLITLLHGEDAPVQAKKPRAKKANDEAQVYPMPPPLTGMGGMQVTLSDEPAKKRGRPRKEQQVNDNLADLL